MPATRASRAQAAIETVANTGCIETLKALPRARGAAFLGEAHPGTLNAIMLLAETEQKQGSAAEARALQARASSIRQQLEARIRLRPTTHPALVSPLRLAYPAEARRLGQEGAVAVQAEMSDQGKPEVARIELSSGIKALDDEALRAALDARFSPARAADGTPVRGALRMPNNFVLKSDAPAPTGSGEGYGERIADRLRREVEFADADKIPGNPAAVVRLLLAPNGKIERHRLVESSGIPEWDAAVTRAIEKAGILPIDTNGIAPREMELAIRPKF